MVAPDPPGADAGPAPSAAKPGSDVTVAAESTAAAEVIRPTYEPERTGRTPKPSNVDDTPGNRSGCGRTDPTLDQQPESTTYVPLATHHGSSGRHSIVPRLTPDRHPGPGEICAEPATAYPPRHASGTMVDMAIRVVRLGSARESGEGLRIGTVRRPPRGVPKEEFATRDFYDVWLPELSPSQDLVSAALRAETDREWAGFVRGYRREMSSPAARHLIDLLVALSHRTDLAIGCYCEDASRCHRILLADLLADAGAELA